MVILHMFSDLATMQGVPPVHQGSGNAGRN